MRVVLPLSAALGGWVSVRVTDQSQDVGAVQQAIHGGAGQQWIAKELVEFVGVAVRRDDGRATFVSESDDLVEIDRFFSLEWTQPEVVDDEQVYFCQSREALVMRVVCAARL